MKNLIPLRARGSCNIKPNYSRDSQRLFVLPSCQASDWEKLQKTLADALEHYNELHAVMDLVLFEEAIQHVYGTHTHKHRLTQKHLCRQ